ncbi:MAG: transcriptional regulator raffinose operon [Paenibacillus sp.]|jgi:AraC-like DNA-binding protein|nr:transcriptional regulator raffinose operon [Paenibacillus sp.]
MQSNAQGAIFTDIRDILITDFNMLRAASFAKNQRMKISHRSNYGLTFAVSGEIVYTLNGMEHTSDREHLLFLPKGQTYSLLCTEAGLFPVINFEIAASQTFSEIMVFQTSDMLPLHDLFWELEVQSKAANAKNRFHILSLLYQMLSHAIIPDDRRQLSPRGELLRPAIEYLEHNYDNPKLNNGILSRKSCVSEVYFRMLFKEEYGISPKQYVQKIRIDKAKELLRSEYFTVTQVSEMVGYSSIFTFSKAFKALAGCTPSNYLKGREDD